MFNADQRAHMADLAARPPSTLCWCGWNPVGRCQNCPPHLTAADKLAMRCPDRHCRAAPQPDLGWIQHTIGCGIHRGENFDVAALMATNLADAYHPLTTDATARAASTPPEES